MTAPAPDDWAFGSGGFAKIYGDRLAQSSLLDRDVATRWCFVFMLSKADAEGRFRCASIAGLARAAAVTLEQAERAITELEAPDADSTTKDEAGRRIMRIPGGWQIVTYAKYREYRTPRQLAEAAKKRHQREARKERRSKGREGRTPHVPGRPGDIPPTALQTTDVKRKTSGDRDSNETDPAVSFESPVPDSARNELLAVCKQIAASAAWAGQPLEAIVQRVSAIPASNRHPAKAGFEDPFAVHISSGWVRGALGRARELLAEVERDVPL